MKKMGWILIFLLFGCNENNTGYGKVHWDRDICERCRMVISDRHFAAQVRGGEKNQLYKFDDLGCALWWLKQQAWDDTRTQIWVTDYLNGEWLDARQAHYVSGLKTPMDYDLGAVKNPVSGSLNFEQAREKILAIDHEHGGNI
jgi:hypothetical protein